MFILWLRLISFNFSSQFSVIFGSNVSPEPSKFSATATSILPPLQNIPPGRYPTNGEISAGYKSGQRHFLLTHIFLTFLPSSSSPDRRQTVLSLTIADLIWFVAFGFLMLCPSVLFVAGPWETTSHCHFMWEPGFASAPCFCLLLCFCRIAFSCHGFL